MAKQIVDPAGVQWRVRRRWYPWRRALPLRDTWNGSESGQQAEPEAGPAATEDSELPRNVVVRVLLLVAAGLVWVVWGLCKVLVYGAAAMLFVAGSLVEWVLELAFMPFVLLLRTFGLMRWPVEIDCRGKHFATRYASDASAAAALEDSLVTQLESGSPLGDSDSEPVGSFEG